MPLADAKIDIDVSDLIRRLDELSRKAMETDKILKRVLGEEQQVNRKTGGTGVKSNQRGTAGKLKEVSQELDQVSARGIRLRQVVSRAQRGVNAFQTLTQPGGNGVASGALQALRTFGGAAGFAGGVAGSALFSLASVAQEAAEMSRAASEAQVSMMRSTVLDDLRRAPQTQKNLILKNMDLDMLSKSRERSRTLTNASMGPGDWAKSTFYNFLTGQPDSYLNMQMQDRVKSDNAAKDQARTLGYTEKEIAVMDDNIVVNDIDRIKARRKLADDFHLTELAGLESWLTLDQPGMSDAEIRQDITKRANKYIGVYISDEQITAYFKTAARDRLHQELNSMAEQYAKAEENGRRIFSTPETGFALIEQRRRNEWVRSMTRPKSPGWSRD